MGMGISNPFNIHPRALFESELKTHQSLNQNTHKILSHLLKSFCQRSKRRGSLYTLLPLSSIFDSFHYFHLNTRLVYHCCEFGNEDLIYPLILNLIVLYYLQENQRLSKLCLHCLFDPLNL